MCRHDAGGRSPSALEDQVAGRLSGRLVDDLVKAGSRSRFTATGVALVLLASAVHAVTLALLGVGGWLVVAGSAGPLRVLGGVCLLAAAVLLPRFPRAPRGPGPVDDKGYPETTALVREVAALVGSPEPTRLQLSEDFDAFAEPTALRGRTLTLGAPLWAACSPQERVALLGHELDIFTPGSMSEDALLTINDRGESEGFAGSGGSAQSWRPVTWPVRAALGGYLRLMRLLNAASSRRREHYADLAAAAARGTAGAVDLLETQLADAGVLVSCNRIGIAPDRPALRPAIEAYARAYDPDARRRNRARAAGDLSSIDASHPLVESVPSTAPAVVVDEDRAARIDAELAARLDDVLRSLADGYRGT